MFSFHYGAIDAEGGGRPYRQGTWRGGTRPCSAGVPILGCEDYEGAKLNHTGHLKMTARKSKFSCWCPLPHFKWHGQRGEGEWESLISYCAGDMGPAWGTRFSLCLPIQFRNIHVQLQKKILMHSAKSVINISLLYNLNSEDCDCFS